MSDETKRSVPRQYSALNDPIEVEKEDPRKEPSDVYGAEGVCNEAARIMAGRSALHGAKERSFESIARRWANHIQERYSIEVPLKPSDVARMMVELKLARLNFGRLNRDAHVDIAGYGALGWEVTQESERR